MDYKSIGVNLIIAIIVAVITAKLSIKGFYKQEIWLRKENRYSDIINDLSMLQRYYGHVFDKAAGFSELTYMEELLEEEYNISRRQLELISFSQGFILKREVAQILSKLFSSSKDKSSNERMGDYCAYFDRMYSETQEAKVMIIEIANKDLKLNSF